jgi:hypothetical protein
VVSSVSWRAAFFTAALLPIAGWRILRPLTQY